jgi:4-hydroxythreonine-4-phosphate dehydrogenase
VTAPVQKSVINSAGIHFSGHTELLAELTHAPQPVMLLVSKQLRVALATTHLPLKAVAAALDGQRLERIVAVIAADLEARFGLTKPRIAILGLNPHAGESGVLGTEEQTIIAPVIERARARGIDAFGPLSADTAFTPEALERCDVVLAMYHDQGLPVIKALGFGDIVNVTLGLPIIRTSVDHGTALPLAGTGKARAESLFAAVTLAAALARGSADS